MSGGVFGADLGNQPPRKIRIGDEYVRREIVASLRQLCWTYDSSRLDDPLKGDPYRRCVAWGTGTCVRSSRKSSTCFFERTSPSKKPDDSSAKNSRDTFPDATWGGRPEEIHRAENPGEPRIRSW